MSDAKSEILALSFNQDHTFLAVASSRGAVICRCHPFDIVHELFELGAVGIAEMLFSTNLLALVGSGTNPKFSTRTLKIWDTDAQAELFSINFADAIIGVRLNRKRLVVVLRTKLQVFDIEGALVCSFPHLKELETRDNPQGICALSANEGTCRLAYPDPDAREESAGHYVRVDDVLCTHAVNTVHVSDHALAALCLSASGTLLASASERGTVLRVFSLPSGAKLRELRRGTRPGVIHSLSISIDEQLLCAATGTGTLHVFKISEPEPEPAQPEPEPEPEPECAFPCPPACAQHAYLAARCASPRTQRAGPHRGPPTGPGLHRLRRRTCRLACLTWPPSICRLPASRTWRMRRTIIFRCRQQSSHNHAHPTRALRPCLCASAPRRCACATVVQARLPGMQDVGEVVASYLPRSVPALDRQPQRQPRRLPRLHRGAHALLAQPCGELRAPGAWRHAVLWLQCRGGTP